MNLLLKDLIQIRTVDDVVASIRGWANKLDALARAIDERAQRSAQSTVLRNLLEKTGTQLTRIERYHQESNDLVAWATRNVFELNLLVRWVLLSPENPGSFIDEAANDEKEVLEGLLEWSDAATPEQLDGIRTRINLIQDLAKKYGRVLKKPLPIRDIAKAVGQESEYKSMYKLMSKHVHPSSWLVNLRSSYLPRGDIWTILVVLAQAYAADTFFRTRQAIGVGEDL